MKFIKTEKGYLDVDTVKIFWIPEGKTVYADAFPIKTFDTELEAVTFLDDLVRSLDGGSSNEFIHDFNANEIANRRPPDERKILFVH